MGFKKSMHILYTALLLVNMQFCIFVFCGQLSKSLFPPRNTEFSPAVSGLTENMQITNLLNDEMIV